jgi:hypothetical protein
MLGKEGQAGQITGKSGSRLILAHIKISFDYCVIKRSIRPLNHSKRKLIRA